MLFTMSDRRPPNFIWATDWYGRTTDLYGQWIRVGDDCVSDGQAHNLYKRPSPTHFNMSYGRPSNL